MRKEDKNNDNFKPHLPFVFNAIIERLNLERLLSQVGNLPGLIEGKSNI
jgi:hypothetical protein